MPRTATAPTIEPSRKGIIAVSLLPLDEASRPPPVVARVRGPDAAALAPWLTTAALTSPLALVEEPVALVPAPAPPLPETPLPETPLPEPVPPLPEPVPPLPETPLPAPTVPVVVVLPFEPELETAAAPFELGEASALELPVMAALVIWYMTLITPQVAITVLLVVDVCVADDPPCDPSPLWLGVTLASLLPPLALPSAIGLQVMSMLPATISLVAVGFEVAFESPTVELPLAVGEEDELASPPFVVPLVVEFPLALDPPELSLVDEPEEDPDALALAPLPLVLPVVEVVALEPELVMAAMPFEMASTSALDIPTIAWPFSV